MKKSIQPKRIILAVDLNGAESTLIERIWQVLEPLSKTGDAIVEPVTVLRREDAAVGGILKTRIGSLRSVAERQMKETLSKLGLTGLAAPKVLFADGSSKQKIVSTLLNHAKKTNCDLIALSSHSRIGMKRLFMGSFAETLSLQSKIPLLVVNPSQRRPSRESRSILFPTDFSDASKEGVYSVYRSFPGTKPKILLFHSLQYQNFLVPLAMEIGAATAYPSPQELFKRERNRLEDLGKQWLKELRSNGISCDFILDEKSLTIGQGINSAAIKNNVRMIALVGKTGKWASAFLGSFAREVMRTAQCPVWLIHMPKKKTGKSNVVKFRPKSVDKETPIMSSGL